MASLQNLKELYEETYYELYKSTSLTPVDRKRFTEGFSEVKQLKEIITRNNASTIIEIDGGVTLENAPSILAAGADVLVAGNTVFKSADPIATIAALKAL